MTSLWKMAQITSKLKAVCQCAGHCPSVALLRQARDSTQLGESESRSDIPSPWDNGRYYCSRRAVPLAVGACAAAHQLAVRDCQGLWSGTRDQGPAPGLARAGASPWSRYHHRFTPVPGLGPGLCHDQVRSGQVYYSAEV